MALTEEHTVAILADAAPAAASPSAISWAAVAGGASAAAAVSIALLALGSGLGFAAASPWPGAAPSVAAFGVAAGLWLIVTQWAASGVGGYVAGRLRTRWVGTHTHEVFFRDTAHGFLTWAVATLMVAVVVTAASSAAVTAAGAPAAMAYETDTLLRTGHADDSPSATFTRAEVGRILARATTKTGLPADDRGYLVTLIASRTGVAPAEAARRVDAAVTAVRADADTARKAASATAIFTALAMFVGAFIACVAAALGGQQRDEHP